MPYLLLAIVALIGVYGLYKFFLAANPRQITSFFITGLFITTCGAFLLMAVTGRLPPAIAMVVAIWPIALAWWKARDTKKKATSNGMTRAAAFEILGLSEKAKYATLGVLFVNVSIGGTLTSFGAPPVLMVAAKWEWNTLFMMKTFGWKANQKIF